MAATLAACKKDPPPQPPIQGSGPAVAPPTTGTPASPGTRGSAPGAAVNRVVSKETRWALGPEDAGPKPKPAVGKPAVSAKTLAVSTDADIAKFKADKAQAETEKAVNATLGAALPQMKPCFDKFGAPTGSVSISVRVHRSGYVNSSSTTGVNADVSTCLDGVLRKLKVTGVQTDSITVTRTFKFKSGAK
jgi:hypothetical protein